LSLITIARAKPGTRQFTVGRRILEGIVALITIYDGREAFLGNA